MTNWSTACESLAAAESSLRDALSAVRAGDIEGVLTTARAYFAACDAVARAAPSKQARTAVLTRHAAVLREMDGVSAAFHEGAHCLAGHALGLGVLKASVARTDGAFAHTKVARYDEALDGDKRSWFTRFAVMTYAGPAGNALVSPPERWTGLQHCSSDMNDAAAALKEAGRNPDADWQLFASIAETLVRMGRDGVLSVALLLLRRTTISREEIVTQLSTCVDDTTQSALETVRRRIDSL